MKKVIYMSVILMLVLGLSLKIYAGTLPAEKHTFKSTEREVNFDIERKPGEVELYFQSAVFSTYDQLIVERVGAGTTSYSVCKTIDLSAVKPDGDQYATVDKFPVSAQTDSYYRLKTIAKDGTVKVYPPLLLPALTR